ncbi:polysaccharide pyruvyl transferase CsaB [Ructibacterium gallinarum]|uniref:Polysaccharide pyruvyl transferase CsaB n=1 Tax=Ructibacterium gallinarum TaxID=2779355 RepID=A0A9D5R914_9FIRM|nr:polysaccharide pyruvyl transferase CsaB [Ructibacterium gallinarum]MBE5039999.1 polysaccharide pyruvyl transferase CsaB [Ructibacterium gallinarum]
MRILMATMQLDIGGAETHIVELSKALARRGVEVIVASNGGAYEQELKEAGIRHIKVPFHSKSPLCLRRAYQLLKQIIFENHIDVVHAHARIPAFLCGLLHKRYHFRFVTTAHWVFSTRFPYNLLTRWGDRSLAVSDDIKDYLVENYGIDPEHIRVTINGIDTEKFSRDTDYSAVAQEFGLQKGRTRIVYVSRMDIDRSFAAHKLIEITPTLTEKIPNLEVVIVGGGNDYEAVKNESEAVNQRLGRRVIITTGSRTDINRFVASGDLFIGVSRAALEAMACEKPAIIAGNEGYIGIFDKDKLQICIDTNFCCRGCEATSAAKLQEDVLAVLTASPEQQAQLGAYARQTVIERYSVETMADDAMKMYISIIKNSKINEVSSQEFEDIDSYLITNPIRESKGKIDIMISGYYGFHNSGDDSILKAMVDSLSANRPELRILALSNDPAETRTIYGIDAIHRFNLPRILWNMRKTRLLISGGGSLIQDITSDKSLTYYLSIIYLAKKLGAKVMLYANGIGPIRHESNHKRIRNVLNRVDLITLREPSSLEELKRFGVTKPKILVTADPAFNLVAASPEESAVLTEKAGLPSGSRYCGIAVRPWKYADPDLEKYIAQIADYIKEKHQLEILFIPMQEAKDLPISQRICNLMKEKGYILKGHPTPSQQLGVVGGASLILGMRLHTLIYAAKMGTPVIGLTYDPKIQATMHYIGQEYTASVEHVNPLTVCRYVDKITKEYEELTAKLKEAGKISGEKAVENTQLALNLLDSCKS